MKYDTIITEISRYCVRLSLSKHSSYSQGGHSRFLFNIIDREWPPDWFVWWNLWMVVHCSELTYFQAKKKIKKVPLSRRAQQYADVF